MLSFAIMQNVKDFLFKFFTGGNHVEEGVDLAVQGVTKELQPAVTKGITDFFM